MLMPLNAKAPHPIDVRAGRNLLIARKRAGITQEELGKRARLTFQQIQKYERGRNRMSLSRAWELAEILGCNVTDFFEGVANTVPPVVLATPGFLPWIAIYERAQAAGCADLLSDIAADIITLSENAAVGTAA
jgi:transcriptional regulator with XRE-family HTH domain